MKNKLNRIAFGTLSICMLLFLTYSCNKDDDAGGGNFNLTTLQASLDQARSLLSSTEEGTMAGDQQPGSKATLQSVINAIERIIDGSGSQADIDDAVVKMNAAIQTYTESVVATAFPYMDQQSRSFISISESIKTTLNGPFTIQGQFYIVNLNQSGFSNNLFACNQGGPDSGFTVRYFADGTVNLLTGNGGWSETFTDPGVFVAGEWIDIAYTNTGNKQTLFVNGQEIVSLDKEHLLAADVTLAIGNSPGFTDRPANLLARKFTVWNTVLDLATIQANATADIQGTESNLEAYFPFGSDLGDSFPDVTGNHTATLIEEVLWVDSPPVIVLDYSQIDASIQTMNEFRASVVEGDQDGNYPVGTIAYIDELLLVATELRSDEGATQDSLNATAASLSSSIELINNNLVADTRGFFVDGDDPNSVGFRVTPNYTPQGDYTYEFNLKLRDLLYDNGDASGDVFGNGTVGFRVQGYRELTEESVLNSGGGWNFTNPGPGFIGPRFPAQTLRSGQWYHIAIVHDNTERATRVFVDGEMVGEALDIDPPAVSGWGEIWLGRGFLKMDGYMEDFRIWDAALTPAEFEADITGSETNLQVYFPMDRVKGVKFSDETGNYTGELRGVVWNTGLE